MVKIIRMGLILAAFCVLAAGSLAYVYMLTQPLISANARQALEQAKREVLPGGVGKAVQETVPGYHGQISMMVGIGDRGRVSGVKILSQQETAGLGAGIVKPNFLRQFSGKSAADPLEAKKDIDAITGATISSRAVCKGVRRALEKFQSGAD